MKHSNLLSQMTSWLTRNVTYREKLFWIATSFLIFLLASQIDPFDDEYEVLIGGLHILKGDLLYSDYFTHHMPLPYFLVAGLEFITLDNFIIMRMIWALVLWGLLIFNSKRILEIFGNGAYRIFYLITWCLVFLPFNYYFSFKSDSLAAHFVFLCLIQIIGFDIKNQRPRNLSLLFFSLLFILHTSLSLIPFVLIAMAYIIIQTIHSRQRLGIKLILSLITASLPFLVMDLHLGLNVINEFKEQVFDFNRECYSAYNYQIPSNLKHFAIYVGDSMHHLFATIINNPWNPLSWLGPLRVVVIVLVLFMLFTVKRRLFWFLTAAMCALMIRGGILTNYDSIYSFHQLPFEFFFCTILLMAMFLSLEGPTRKYRSSILNFSGGVYLILIVSLASFWSIRYARAIMIYENNGTALENSMLLQEADFQVDNKQVWILPFAVKDQYLNNAGLSMKYSYLLPWQTSCPETLNDVLNDLDTQQPEIILWDGQTNIWGYIADDYASNFKKHLNENYQPSDSLTKYQIWKIKK